MNGRFKEGKDRNQLVLFPTAIDDKIGSDNIVRVLDAFIDYLDLKELGFKNAESKRVGQKGYNPKDMLKLYLYGYMNKIRSSRKLMRESKRNIELMWLLKGLEPDFRCIADFRKDNVESIKKVYVQFNLVCKKQGLISLDEYSQDGTKIKAVNSKEKNYTLNKLDDRIRKLEDKIDSYLKEIEENDKREKEREEVEKIEDIQKKLAIYKQYEKELEETNESQKSVTDPESKLMKNNGKYDVCYNNQVVVEGKNKLVVGFQVNNNPADIGSMESTMEQVKTDLKIERVVTDITDKGYQDRDDMARCLENGIIPMVTQEEDKEEIELEFNYEENSIDDVTRESEKKEDIKKCLRAGVIPKVYEGKITKIEIQEKEVVESISDIETFKLTEEELRDKAIREKIFTRDIKSNKVFCPQGEILRKKSKNKNGIKYCNKLACKRCKNPCCKSEFKEVIFRDNQKVVVPNGTKLKTTKTKRKKTKVKKVVASLKINKEQLKMRMSLSEHPHANMKRWDDASYFLLKGREKVSAELALYYCGYNMRRAVKVLGVKELLEFFKKEKERKRGYYAQSTENKEKAINYKENNMNENEELNKFFIFFC